MTYLSAGFSATCGHGYAVAFIQDGAWLCNDCWQGVRAFVHQATGVTLVLNGHDDVASDARKPAVRQPKCGECMTAYDIIAFDEESDYANSDRDEVQEAYAHIEGHDA